MIHMGGFVPWHYKYVKDGICGPGCKHEGVETEWATMLLLSQYNVFADADACCTVGTMANSALWQHHPLPDKLTQKFTPPTVEELQQRGLVQSDGKTVTPKAYAVRFSPLRLFTCWSNPAMSVHKHVAVFCCRHIMLETTIVQHGCITSFWISSTTGVVVTLQSGGPLIQSSRCGTIALSCSSDCRVRMRSSLLLLAFFVVLRNVRLQVSSNFPTPVRCRNGERCVHLRRQRSGVPESICGEQQLIDLTRRMVSRKHQHSRCTICFCTACDDPFQLPDNGTAWGKWNQEWFDKFDLNFTGFVINGDAGTMTAEAEVRPRVPTVVL